MQKSKHSFINYWEIIVIAKKKKKEYEFVFVYLFMYESTLWFRSLNKTLATGLCWMNVGKFIVYIVNVDIWLFNTRRQIFMQK